MFSRIGRADDSVCVATRGWMLVGDLRWDMTAEWQFAHPFTTERVTNDGPTTTQPAPDAHRTFQVRRTRMSRLPTSRSAESGTNRGRLRGLILPVGVVGEVGVPAPVVVGEGVVEDPGADLQ